MLFRSGSGKQLTVQGVIYTVMAITEDALELQMRSEYCTRGADDEKVRVPLDEACTQLRLCHAMCYTRARAAPSAIAT